MKTTLNASALRSLAAPVKKAHARRRKPAAGLTREPVHTVYGGAHLFKADTARKLGNLGLRALEDAAPDSSALSDALNLPEDRGIHRLVYSRVVEKLRHEPIEDLRIDFEDGYGHRSDAEEDGHAIAAAQELAAGMESGSLPPFIGIRIKALTPELFTRSTRTLDLFLTTLVKASGGRVPQDFVVTLPKVTVAEEVQTLARLLGALEKSLELKQKSLELEFMVETPEALLAADGRVPLAGFVRAASGRCVAAHFGPYDYTAALDVTAATQALDHPACDAARLIMQRSLAPLNVSVSDGPTTTMPIGPHRPEKGGAELSREELAVNREVVFRAWRQSYRNIRHALLLGIYRGWDLHPAQLPVRYAATYTFFLESLEPMSKRLAAFVDKAAQATRVGEIFDDAATGQGLLNFFLRGIACGALTEEDARATGMTLEELRTRSFLKILQARRKA